MLPVQTARNSRQGLPHECLSRKALYVPPSNPRTRHAKVIPRKRLLIGIGLGTIPPIVGLLLPLFVILFVMFEVFAASVYSVSGNLLLIAIVESLCFARTAALSWPITFKF
jgi:hypothetical protein